MTALSELIGRLEALSGPDRGTDWLIHSTCAQPWQKGAEWRGSLFVDVDGTPADPDDIDWSKDGLKWFRDHLPRYTASLDAAVALVERKLPGWTIASIGQDDRKDWHAELREGYRTSYSTVKLAGAKTPAIALLLALLRALEQSNDEVGRT